MVVEMEFALDIEKLGGWEWRDAVYRRPSLTLVLRAWACRRLGLTDSGGVNSRNVRSGPSSYLWARKPRPR